MTTQTPVGSVESRTTRDVSTPTLFSVSKRKSPRGSFPTLPTNPVDTPNRAMLCANMAEAPPRANFILLACFSSWSAGRDGRPVKTRSTLISPTTTISIPLLVLLECVSRRKSAIVSEKLHDGNRQNGPGEFRDSGAQFKNKLGILP